MDYSNFDIVFFNHLILSLNEIKLSAVLIISAVLFVLIFLKLIGAVGRYRVYETLGVERPYFSFIPFLKIYSFGEAAEKNLSYKKRPKFKVTLLIFYLLNSILPIVSTVLLCFSSVNIMKDYVKENSIINGLDNFLKYLLENRIEITKILIPFLVSTLLFVISVLVYIILKFICTYRIFKAFTPKGAAVLTVLIMLIPLLESIVYFAIRHRKLYKDEDDFGEEFDFYNDYENSKKVYNGKSVYKNGFTVITDDFDE